MTDDERLDLLDETLYLMARHASALTRGVLRDSHRERMGMLSGAELDDVVAAIEWGVPQRDLDYRSMVPSLPAERATIVAWLERVLRELRAMRAQRGSS